MRVKFDGLAGLTEPIEFPEAGQNVPALLEWLGARYRSAPNGTALFLEIPDHERCIEWEDDMTEKVLLVDDEEEFVETLAERMRSRGMEVATSNSGGDALDLIDQEPYDVVVLDLQMPGMDGLEALARIKRRQPDIQVVLLTGHATVEKGVEAMKQGALEFLEKPIDLSKLSEVIHNAKAEKMILVEQDAEERIREIIREKSW